MSSYPNTDPFAQNPSTQDPCRAVGGQTFVGGPSNAILGLQKPFSYPNNNPRSVPGSSPGGNMGLASGAFSQQAPSWSSQYLDSGGLAGQAARSAQADRGMGGVPGFAYGGTVMHRAIVGDPQADGAPNPELVEAYGPIRVTPLRNMPQRQAHASWARLPHYDTGTPDTSLAPAAITSPLGDTNLSSGSNPPPAPSVFQDAALLPGFNAANLSPDLTPSHPLSDSTDLGGNASTSSFGSGDDDDTLPVPMAPPDFHPDGDSYLQPQDSTSADQDDAHLAAWAGWSPSNWDDATPDASTGTNESGPASDEEIDTQTDVSPAEDSDVDDDDGDSSGTEGQGSPAAGSQGAGNGPTATPDQARATKTAAEIEAVPASEVSREELNDLHSRQAADSFQAPFRAAKDWYDLPGPKDPKDLYPYIENKMHERWQSLKEKMEAELDAGDPHAAATTIRQLYSDLAAGGAVKGEPTAAKFLSDWLKADPSDTSKGVLSRSDMQSLLDTKRVQQTLGASAIKYIPELAGDGPKTIHVTNQILPEITIGEGNRNMYHTLGQYTYGFTGTIQKGRSITTDGQTTTPLTLDGTFTVHDTYDWADSHGKKITLMNFEIPDSYAHLVEQEGLAKSYPVSGTLRSKVSVTATTPAKPGGR